MNESYTDAESDINEWAMDLFVALVVAVLVGLPTLAAAAFF